MKILYLDWNSFGRNEQINAFNELGNYVELFPFNPHVERYDESLNTSLTNKLRNSTPDFVFSFNYFPQVSNTCNALNIKYVSWIYDSPYVQLYSKSVINPCNYIFIFDKNVYLHFINNRIDTVYYLPLASDPTHLDSFNDFDSFKLSPCYNQTDIAFVGSLYTEDHQFFERMTDINQYTKGYLDALINAQMNIYGINFIEESLSQRIIDDMFHSLKLAPDPDGVESFQYLYAQYVINRKITSIERTKLLNLIGEKYSYDLYTRDKGIQLKNCINHGNADPITMAPYVYKTAKINLNITLRSISSGIPLRAFEIMGSGGFLLTNYQPDFADCYIADEDYVYFESPEDMMTKIEYYLSHEEERKKIASNGYQKTLQHHTFKIRAQEIMNIIQG